MILSFRDGWLQGFFVEDVHSKKIPADLESRLFRKLQLLDDATSDADLRVPPSNYFERLKGKLVGSHDSRQRTMAAGVPVGWQPRASVQRLLGQPQLSVR